MPGTPSPIIDPVLGQVWGSMKQGMQNAKQAASNARAQAQQGSTYGGYGNANVTSISGSNLQQIVQLGATFNTADNLPVEGFPEGGVPAATLATGHMSNGLANGASGIAVPSAIATGLITLQAKSTSATLVSTLTGSFVNNMQIGAYTIDLETGVTTEAIVPGTYFTISGSTITLSQDALVTATETSLYCVAATFSQLT